MKKLSEKSYGTSFESNKVWSKELFERRDELLTISSGSLRENIWKYIERQVGERSVSRFIWQGFIFTLFSSFPTVLGSVLRGILYRIIFDDIGSTCFIEKNVRFNAPGRIKMGNRVSIGEGSALNAGVQENNISISGIRLGNDVHLPRYCVLKAGPGDIVINDNVCIGQFTWIDGSGGVEIGKYSQIASHVVIVSTNHNYKDISKFISFQGKEHKKVKIGNDVWIGTHAVVLPGVTVGDKCVIGAGAVITHDIPEYSIAVGVPAKVIGKRN